MPDGGWVATHEDITERQRLEQQRDTMRAQENRQLATESAISSFRKRVEEVLGIVSNSTDAMKSTANALIGSSHETTETPECRRGPSRRRVGGLEPAPNQPLRPFERRLSRLPARPLRPDRPARPGARRTGDRRGDDDRHGDAGRGPQRSFPHRRGRSRRARVRHGHQLQGRSQGRCLRAGICRPE